MVQMSGYSRGWVSTELSAHVKGMVIQKARFKVDHNLQ